MTTDTRVAVNDLRRGWIARSDEVRDAIGRVVESGWYVHGPEHHAFEAELAGFLGVAHAAGVASGTDALVLAMLAVGCGLGSEIVVAPNAGGYSSCAARQIGARVTYCDVDPETLLATAETIARALGPETRAVVVTHLYGNVADVEAIRSLCAPKGIAVIEDCAQAIGGRDASGRRAGSLGDVATFSFYPTKNLGAMGDAGAVATSDDRIDASVRSLRQYGWGSRYLVTEAGGRNSRLDEIQAAVLRIGLRRVDEINERRREIVRRYASACEGSPFRMVTGAGCETVGHLAVVRTDDRDRLRTWIEAAGIGTDIHYPVPDHRQPGFEPPLRATNLAVSERAAREILTVPCYAELTHDEVERVARALAQAGEPASV